MTAPGQGDLYEDSYRGLHEGGDQLARWREFCARGKADHVESLCAQVGLRPKRVVEIGCGDGALLAELSQRKFGRAFTGFDVAEAGIELLRRRHVAGLERAETFDGSHLPGGGGVFDLAILSHVLEHVEAPAALLREAARVAHAVLVEVPLERNISARRSATRSRSATIGHLHFYDRQAVVDLVDGAGLRIAAELSDPLTLGHHSFFAATLGQHAKAMLKAAVRRSVFAASSPLSRELFTVHFACLCLPA